MDDSRHWDDSLYDRARAALAHPEPVAPTDEELARRFRAWWHDEGSGLPPLPGMDHKEHVRRISETAWANGAYVARYARPAIQPVPVSERLPRPEDCDAGECWAWDTAAESWNRTHYALCNHFTHWLPANALLTPEAQ
jgi:hypothetical protein